MATKRQVLRDLAKGKGPLARIGDDEPIFILRAHDKFSANTIREWCMKVIRVSYEEWRRANPNFEFTDVDPTPPVPKVDKARKLAKEIDAWQGKHGSKVPD